MYCWNCGKEIDDNAVICVNCGVAVNGKKNVVHKDESGLLGIIGFILAFLFPVAGLICCIIADKKASAADSKLAISGIIISIVFLALGVIAIIISISYISCLESNFF